MPPIVLDARRNPPMVYENVDVALARQYRDQAQGAAGQGLVDAAAEVAKAKGWAQSSTPPDPSDPASKSAKAWAGDSAYNATVAAASTQTPGSYGRPSGTNLLTGSTTSSGTYVFEAVATEQRIATKVRVYNPFATARSITLKRFLASTGAQVGADYTITIPAGVGEVSVAIPAGAFNVQAGEKFGFYHATGNTCFTFVAGVGDSGGYRYIAGNATTAPVSALNTTAQLQVSIEFGAVVLTGTDYAATKSRVGTLETSKASADAVGKGPRPLDGIPGIYGAYGTRRLLATYSGPLVRLRRSTDDTEQDFYPALGSDLLDVAAITTWLAGGSAFIRTVYDHRGGNHWTQATAGLQPSLTISGAFAYISTASTKKLSPPAALLDFGRYKDGNTIAYLGRLPTAPPGNNFLIYWSQGDGATQIRMLLQTTAARGLRWQSGPYDDLSAYVTADSPTVGSAWFRAVGRSGWRSGFSNLIVNGTALAPVPMSSGPSDDTASLGASINGTSTSTDQGTAQDIVAIVLYTRELTAQEAATVDAILATYAPDYVAPARAPTIWMFGDSEIDNGEAIYTADPTKRVVSQLSSLLGGRMVRNKGVGSQTSSTIKARLLAQTIMANEVVPILAGVNDDIASSTANHEAVLQNLQDMYNYVVAAGGRPLIATIPFGRDETSGTSKHTNKETFNQLIRSTFPNNYVEIANTLATAPVSAAPGAAANTDGATPQWLLIETSPGVRDNFHRNPDGAAIEAATYRAAIVAKGW